MHKIKEMKRLKPDLGALLRDPSRKWIVDTLYSSQGPHGAVHRNKGWHYSPINALDVVAVDPEVAKRYIERRQHFNAKPPKWTVVKIEPGRYKTLERAHFQLDLSVTVQKQVIQRQTAESVVMYDLYAQYATVSRLAITLGHDTKILCTNYNLQLLLKTL